MVLVDVYLGKHSDATAEKEEQWLKESYGSKLSRIDDVWEYEKELNISLVTDQLVRVRVTNKTNFGRAWKGVLYE